ncbi:MAG: PSD1 and planctomycete cytochrome C domain-containing protein [Fuerstiella sp.]|nr:PSD1 and planctomycete cytochrome C domain-containing protein [Fuerstiella sp.]
MTLAIALCVPSHALSIAAESPTFSRDIQPLFAKHCVVCHGPNKAEGGLRLDISEQARAELESGSRSIIPGDPQSSELMRRITADDTSDRMPPEGDPLSVDDIEKLRQWIRDGAGFEQHWAYQPVKLTAPPEVTQQDWVRNPIDQFVLARLEAEGMTPSPAADRATLIKRLYYDLNGLPPTPEEVDAFLTDEASDAWEILLNRLLESDHFGERWGRHWLDKARYADSDGYEKDRSRPNAWRYRDWVIDAINQDMPFDQFTIEQLAGDLLPNATPMQKLATAFHRQTLTNTEGGTDQEQFRVEATFDRTETTSTVWMALTMTCARCHTHKYDQITQREYYELFAFFNNADEASIHVARSHSDMAKYRRDKSAYDHEMSALMKQYENAKGSLQTQIAKWTDEISAQIKVESPDTPTYHHLHLVEAQTSSRTQLALQENGSLLASGSVPDKDSYTLIFELPANPIAGIRIETLVHESLPGKGPGRATNGNFVLSQLRAYISTEKDFSSRTVLKLATADSDFSEEGFSAEFSVSSAEKSGWAISPQTGSAHQITAYTAQPVPVENARYLQIVLDQQYGGQHVIGCLRVSTVSEFDPVRALPTAVADAIRTKSAYRTEKQREIIAAHVASISPVTTKIADSIAELKERTPQAPLLPVRVIAPAERVTKTLHRGDFLQPVNEVTTNTLSIISGNHLLQPRKPDDSADRLDLALWLVSPDHPLTARVTVNQIWAHLFGRGIVPSQNDFGVRGELPTHPKLLDWLAWQFSRDMNWSRKTLIRTILMSSTWRQSSHHRQELRNTDPANQLLARQNRFRVEAEIVRDLHLAVSGLLNPRIGGPSVFPPLPPGVAELSYANKFKWKTSEGNDGYRRGMYTFFKRTAPHPTLISFDCPDSNTSRLQRESSNTPLQALVTLNNEVYAEAAQAFVRRIFAETGDGDRQLLIRAMRLCVARMPEDSELDRFAEFLSMSREYYYLHPDDAKLLIQKHPTKQLAPEENAAWVATVRLILNLDEFIVRD